MLFCLKLNPNSTQESILLNKMTALVIVQAHDSLVMKFLNINVSLFCNLECLASLFEVWQSKAVIHRF